MIITTITIKIIISILGWIFVFFNWNTIILYTIIYTLIICSFIYSKNKKKFIFKLIFILGFWNIVTIIFNIVWYDIDLTIINNIMILFLVNYIDQYSDLNPSNSKHILDALHNLLKELNIHDLFSSGGGGNGSGPFFVPLDTDEEKNFSDLVIKTNEKSWNRISYNGLEYLSSLNNDQVQFIIGKIDNYNKELVYPKGGEMIEEKNKLISTNLFLDYNFHHPYGLARINMLTNNLTDWFIEFKHHILADVEKYNKLMLCKFYYENKNKDLLPNKFKDFWKEWQLAQVSIQLGSDLEIIKIKSNSFIKNFFKEDLAYGELNDNILIIGAGILCKVYIYANLHNNYYPDLNTSKVEFFTKGWEYYQEALQKYYFFFHHYNWFCKLYSLNNFTKSDILIEILNDDICQKRVTSIPPLYKYILDGWRQKPDWFNNIRPVYYSEYKNIPLFCKLGLEKAQSFIKLTTTGEKFWELTYEMYWKVTKMCWKWPHKYTVLAEWTNEEVNKIFSNNKNKLFKSIEDSRNKRLLIFAKNKQFDIKLTNIEKNFFNKQSLKFTKNTK